MRRENPRLLRQLRTVLGDGWWEELSLSGALGSTLGVCDPDEAGFCAPRPDARPRNGTDLKRVTIHTDGACRNNPGPGGWAAILRYGRHVKQLKGAEPATTNNRMELQAALAGLSALKQKCIVEIFTDSKYLRDGISRWLARWKANGWQTFERTPVKNKDLWLRLEAQCARHDVSWTWLKAHVGHPDNERCDQLARAEIVRLEMANS
jgi:ribonuclease HI